MKTLFIVLGVLAAVLIAVGGLIFLGARGLGSRPTTADEQKLLLDLPSNFHAEYVAQLSLALPTNAEDLSPAALHQRGVEHFFAARIPEAIADWDREIALSPQRAPYHWQRGLALYYADDYKMDHYMGKTAQVHHQLRSK